MMTQLARGKVEGDLLVCEGTTTKNPGQITVKFDKTTFKLISLAENGEEAPLDRMIPEGENGHLLEEVAAVDSCTRSEAS